MRITLPLLLMLALMSAPAIATHGNIVGVTCSTLHSSQSVNPSSTTQGSTVFSSLGASENQSLYYTITGTGGSPNVSIVIRSTVDGSGYVYPTHGCTVTTVTADGSGLAPLAIPMCTGLVVDLANNSSTVTATCSVTVCSQ